MLAGVEEKPNGHAAAVVGRAAAARTARGDPRVARSAEVARGSARERERAADMARAAGVACGVLCAERQDVSSRRKSQKVLIVFRSRSARPRRASQEICFRHAPTASTAGEVPMGVDAHTSRATPPAVHKPPP